MNVSDYGERNPATPSQHPTPDQLALARRYVEREAPDVLEVLFGEVS